MGIAVVGGDAQIYAAISPGSYGDCVAIPGYPGAGHIDALGVGHPAGQLLLGRQGGQGAQQEGYAVIFRRQQGRAQGTQIDAADHDILLPRVIPAQRGELPVPALGNRDGQAGSAQAWSVGLHRDAAGAGLAAHHDEQLSRKQAAAGDLVSVLIGAVAVIQAQQRAAARYLHIHPVTGVFHRISFVVHGGNLNEGDLSAAAPQAGAVSLQNQAFAFSRRHPAGLTQQISVFIISLGFQDTLGKGDAPQRQAVADVQPIDLPRAQGNAVQQQLRRGAIGHDGHIDHLPGVPIPADTDMHHGRIRPHGLIKIIAVLGETGGIRLTEIAAAGMVGRGLADIINAGPDELPQGIGRAQILRQQDANVLRAPAGVAVHQR